MYYIGVDLGGTTIKAGLVNEKYEILMAKSLPTNRERGANEILKDMALLCKQLISENNLEEKDIASIGIGCPGLASAKDGIIFSSSNLNFTNVNVKSIMSSYIDLPIYVENDANCAAFGEVLAGAAQGEKEAVIVTIGTGVGGGLILDGKIHRGGFFGAGEIGHQVINIHETNSCGCGRKGCWEQYASATALVKAATTAAANHPESLLAKNEEINGKVIFDAAKAGDQVALDVLDNFYSYLAQGVVNLINILEPNVVVIGGGISAQKDYIIQPIKQKVQAQMYGGLDMKTEIKAAQLGNDAGIIGAAFLEKSVI